MGKTKLEMEVEYSFQKNRIHSKDGTSAKKLAKEIETRKFYKQLYKLPRI